MSELIEHQESSQNLPVEANIESLKSMYYWLNAKPDTHLQIFPKPKLVTLNDVIVLNTKVQQKLENHHLFTNITSITISFEKGEIKAFNAWEVFKNNHWEIPEKTESVSINWDITVKLPNYKLPQKHTLKVRIGSSLRPNEFFQILTNSDSIIELRENASFIVCKVDFINVVLSKELIKIVEEWYETLQPLHSKSKFQSFLEKRKTIIASAGHYLTTFIGLATLFIAFKIHLKNYQITSVDKDLYLDAVFWVMCLFATYFIFNIIGASFGQLIYNKVNAFRDPHTFAFTKGDRNEQTELERKNGKISNNLVWHFVIRLIVAAISIVVSKVILHK